MVAKIIDGKAFAANLRGEIARKVELLKQQHSVTPGLAVVLVGEDPASQVYVRSKGKQTVEAGMNSYEHKLDASTSQEDLLALIDKLNKDPDVHGILVQLPLPDHIDEETVVNAVSVDKD
ncbi:MAG: tetrahydrofolate dehydrogenase/cyclohydrolase catalytic domain-containing protein, partial [Gammaproteobacteria bacterium]